ncbi:RICIN domain-containing protein [Kitasatospora xanthocidica]|uniref:RICIN domain-containing protein n=1 Tax=Kitasatospora xanthocidica TaxID=83382 RepID=UPI0036E01785
MAGHTYRAQGSLAAGPQAGRTYTVTSVSSAKRAAVRDGSTADGAAVTQYAATTGANQQWRLTDAGSGTYTLAAVHSGKCLDVPGDKTATEGAPLQQWACWSGAGNQKWRLEAAGSDSYRLVSVASGKCLDVPGASTADNVQLIQWTCNSAAANQKWRFAQAG